MTSTLVIVGVGLIGGSFGLAARRHGVFERVLGLDDNPHNATEAVERKVVDEVVDEVPRDACVLLATSPGAIVDWVVRLADHPHPVTDVGSIKKPIIDGVREACGRLPAQFVPGHPVAGSERSGPGAARASLFAGRTHVLTPGPETDPAAVDAVDAWWTGVGANVKRMTAAEHDTVLAFTSHLPHLVSFALMQGARTHHFDFVGGGFRDFTRIAASDPGLWVEIFLANRGPLLETLDEFDGFLAAAREALAAGDAETLRAMIQAASDRRRELDGHG